MARLKEIVAIKKKYKVGVHVDVYRRGTWI